MQLSILYLARLREALGRGSESLELPDATSVAVLVDNLRSRGGSWAKELAAGRPVRIAVNKEMIASNVILRDGDEVALFPPVTGG
jgi:molybdopterin synthase sulfur carrier subunit